MDDDEDEALSRDLINLAYAIARGDATQTEVHAAGTALFERLGRMADEERAWIAKRMPQNVPTNGTTPTSATE